MIICTKRHQHEFENYVISLGQRARPSRKVAQCGFVASSVIGAPIESQSGWTAKGRSLTRSPRAFGGSLLEGTAGRPAFGDVPIGAVNWIWRLQVIGVFYGHVNNYNFVLLCTQIFTNKTNLLNYSHSLSILKRTLRGALESALLLATWLHTIITTS